MIPACCPAATVVHELGGVARVGPTAFAVRSYNPAHPSLDVSGNVGRGALEIYDAPGGGPASPGAAARQAQLMAGAAGAARAGVRGRTNSVRVTPGRVMTVSDHPLSSLDGAYFVTGVRFEVHQRRRGAAEGTEPAITCTFRGIAKDTAFVPPRTTPPAEQAGIQTGVVGGAPGTEIHPTGAGEVRVQQHWDREGARDDQSGTWMRVAQRGANDSLQLPRVGWNVLTFNEEGAVDAPSVLARVNDGEHPPAYALPANKTRVVYKTATSPADGTFNEIYFEDREGSEEMFINASKDMNILVQRVKVEGVEHDSRRVVGNDHRLMVVDSHAENIVADQSIAVGNDDRLEVGHSYQESVHQSGSLTIGGNRKLSASECTVTSMASHNISVGAARIDACLGGISADAGKLFSLLTGGAKVSIAKGGIAEDCGGASIQTIGGAKLEFTKGARPLDVQKRYFETVGGLMKLKADGCYVDAATKSSKWTAGVKLSTDAGQRTIIKAADKITLRCGRSSITIQPETITVKASKLELKNSELLEVETKTIEHN